MTRSTAAESPLPAIFSPKSAAAWPEVRLIVATLEEGDPALEQRLASWGLSVRTRNVLQREGIVTLAQLGKFSDKKLLAMKNLGLKSLHELRQALIERVGYATPAPTGSAASRKAFGSSDRVGCCRPSPAPGNADPHTVAERGCIVVQVSCPRLEVAQALSEDLLARRLVACAHIREVQTTYCWKGRIVRDVQEVVLELKTVLDLFEEVDRVVQRRHPYEVPSVHFTRIDGGSAAYLRWIRESVEPAKVG